MRQGLGLGRHGFPVAGSIHATGLGLGKFPWPETAANMNAITVNALNILLDTMDNCYDLYHTYSSSQIFNFLQSNPIDL